MDLQIVLNTFATDVFRKQADLDYIAARACFRMQLRQQILWAGQQALEKYFKAILLFNGRSARYPSGKRKEFGHDLAALLEEVATVPIFRFELEREQEQFVRYLAKQGPTRYLGTTGYSFGASLHQLDATVWHARRYCQYMADRGIGSKAPILGMREAVVRSALDPSHKVRPQRFRLFNGELEKVLGRPSNDPARRALIWANLYYGSKRRTKVTYRTFSSSDVPPHERGWTGVDWEEVQRYVKL